MKASEINMNKIITVLFRTMFPRYGNFAKIVMKNNLIRLVKPKIENKHLFILSPPLCGSTLLNEILSTSASVSVNNPTGTREGQNLPSVKKMMFDDDTRWDRSVDFDWTYVRQEWMKYWDTSKPILLEKSPPNIMRASSISKAFPNAYFIIFHRNPYCHCESMLRRNKYSVKEAASFALDCLQFQKTNIETLSNYIRISYEDLTDNPTAFTQKIKSWLPELDDLNTDLEFSAHNFKGKPLKIKNLNSEKFNKLTQAQINDINEEFYKRREILTYFNYPIIEKAFPA